MLFFVLSLSANAQTKQESCVLWKKQADTTNNLNLLLKINTEAAKKIDGKCKVRIFLNSGDIYVKKQKIDSATFFYNKAIKLSETLEDIELISFSNSKKGEMFLYFNKTDKASYQLKKARQSLENGKYDKAWVQYYNTKQLVSQALGNYKKAITYLDSSMVFNEKLKDTLNLSITYHNKAYSFNMLSRYESAITNYLKAIELKESLKNPLYIEITYYTLALAYNSAGQYKLAIKYAEKSLEISKKTGYDLLTVFNYTLISSSSRKNNNFENALKVTDSALVYAKKLNSNEQIANTYNEKGRIYFDKYKNYKKAEDYFTNAYALTEASNNNPVKHNTLCGLIDVYINKRDFINAKKNLVLLDSLNKKINSIAYTSKIYKSYSNYYEKIGQATLAMKYFKEHKHIEDSIANIAVKNKIAELDKKFDIKSKELKILSLNKEKKEQKAIIKVANFKRKIYLALTLLLASSLIFGFWIFSKLRKQKQNLIITHSKLNETNSIKNRLFSIIAHDLRGMLLPFQRSGKIVKYHLEEGDNNRAIVVAQEIEKNSTNLSNMLDNLLDWSLNQMNGYALNPIEVSLKEELQTIITGFKVQATFKSTTMDLKCEKEETVCIDKGAFHVIFRNLIGNALKYTENGKIVISFKKVLNTIEFDINDTGIGMHKNQLDSLFELKNNKTTIGTQGEKGTGIGLNLVYRFVKLMQGDIIVSSEERIGTSFNITLPILEAKKENEIGKLPVSA